jgi:hypothetical protein
VDAPAYLGVEYLVISVLQGKVKSAGLFHWDTIKKEFQS